MLDSPQDICGSIFRVSLHPGLSRNRPLGGPGNRVLDKTCFLSTGSKGL